MCIVVLPKKCEDEFMKLVDELAESCPIAYGYKDGELFLSYDMVDRMIRFSKSQQIKNFGMLKVIKRKYRHALMDTEVWKTRFCFEDIYHEADQHFIDIINSMDLCELRKFLQYNIWEKGMEAGIMADWDIVANTCAGGSVMPSFTYYLFKRENNKWRKIDQTSIDIKSKDEAEAHFRDFNEMDKEKNHIVLFRRTIFE